MEESNGWDVGELFDYIRTSNSNCVEDFVRENLGKYMDCLTSPLEVHHLKLNGSSPLHALLLDNGAQHDISAKIRIVETLLLLTDEHKSSSVEKYKHARTSLLQIKDDYDMNSIQFAVFNNVNHELTKLLLSAWENAECIDIDMRTGCDSTLLHLIAAAKFDAIPGDMNYQLETARHIIKIMRKAGNNKVQSILNTKNKWGLTPLHVALLYGGDNSIYMIDEFVHAGADISMQTESTKENALHLISKTEFCSGGMRVEIAKAMLKDNASFPETTLETETKSFMNPIHAAIFRKAPAKLINVLLRGHENLSFKPKSDTLENALHIVLYAHHDVTYQLSVLEELLKPTKEQAFIYSGDTNNDIVENLKVLRDRKMLKEVAKDTLEAVDMLDNYGHTPLHVAIMYNVHPRIIACLLTFGAKSYTKTSEYHNNAFHLMVTKKHKDSYVTMAMLLALEARLVLANNINGNTPVHMAVRHENAEMVKQLMAKDVSGLQKLNHNNCNILQMACMRKAENLESLNVLSNLLESGKLSYEDVNRRNERDLVNEDLKTLSDIREAFQKQSINKLERYFSHYTPLQIAAKNLLPGCCKLLIRNGADHSISTSGGTALHFAARNGRYSAGDECVQQLLRGDISNISNNCIDESKARTRYLFKMQDSEGDTALNLAIRFCTTGTVGLFLNDLKQQSLESTILQEIYAKCPSALVSQLDRGFTVESMRGEIEVDFGSITGYTISETDSGTTECIRRCNAWPTVDQIKVLKHPLVKLFVAKQMGQKRVAVWLQFMWTVLWLLAYSYLILFQAEHAKNNSVEWPLRLASVWVFVKVLLTCFDEFIDAFEYGVCGYFKEGVTSWFTLPTYCFAIANTVLLCNSLHDWDIVRKYSNAIGILLACSTSMREFGYLHRAIGYRVGMLFQIFRETIIIFTSCLPLIIGCTISFVLLFDKNFKPESMCPSSLAKILVMTTAGFDFSTTFENENTKDMNETQSDTNGTDPDFVSHNVTLVKIVNLVAFVTFLIMLPIGLYNLMTGFALAKIQRMQKVAKMDTYVAQIRYIHYLEIRRKFFHKFASGLQKFKVTLMGVLRPNLTWGLRMALHSILRAALWMNLGVAQVPGLRRITSREHSTMEEGTKTNEKPKEEAEEKDGTTSVTYWLKDLRPNGLIQRVTMYIQGKPELSKNTIDAIEKILEAQKIKHT